MPSRSAAAPLQQLSHKPLMLVVGGKTRLGDALMSEIRRTGNPVLLLARSTADASTFAQRFPDVTVLGDFQDLTNLPASPETCVAICALGPVHPTRPSFESDAAALERDLATLARVICCCSGRVHVILVSTVLALAPGRDRCYYGGFKNLVESMLARMIASRPDARLSVLYAGRLVSSSRRSTIAASTRYSSLARKLLQVSAGERAQNCLVGIDARLWLALRCLRLGASVLTGRLLAMPLSQRDGDARA